MTRASADGWEALIGDGVEAFQRNLIEVVVLTRSAVLRIALGTLGTA